MIVTNIYIDSGSGTRKRYGWNNKPWYQHHVNSSEITSWHFFISVTDGHWLYFRPHVLPTKGLWVHNWNFEICCPSNLHCDTVMLQFCTCQGSWRVQNCNLIGWSYFIKILIRNASQGFTNSDWCQTIVVWCMWAPCYTSTANKKLQNWNYRITSQEMQVFEFVLNMLSQPDNIFMDSD